MQRIVRRGFELGALAAMWLAAGAVYAQPPSVPVQGYLSDRADAPLDGPIQMTFRLYSAVDATVPLFEETQTISVDRGAFTARIGAVSRLDLALFQGVADPHIGVSIASDDELTPRLPIGTVGYAAVAAFCAEATQLEGQSAADFASASHSHAFSDLVSVPADLADGDNDTTYSGADFATSSQSCGAGSVAHGIDAAGALSCVADNAGVTQVVAGAGLSGGGSSSSVTINFAPRTQTFTLELPLDEGFTTRSLGLTPVANSACFLSYVRFGDDNDEDDTSRCLIVSSAGNWVLQGNTTADEAASGCGATCLVW